ncbi:hypothetical protein LCGC14_2893760 [marine sediment metagenome]|uniref:Uncharacterized protein n=1 Tax=marine sediment metagenome TaxID=412755 RepID=A0A0F8XWU7_9ZZZZ
MRTPQQVYLEAARMLAEGESEFSCFAVEEAGGASDLFLFQLSVNYLTTFSSGGNSISFCDAIEDFAEGDEEKANNLRVLMTTLMAVCWKDFR